MDGEAELPNLLANPLHRLSTACTCSRLYAMATAGHSFIFILLSNPLVSNTLKFGSAVAAAQSALRLPAPAFAVVAAQSAPRRMPPPPTGVQPQADERKKQRVVHSHDAFSTPQANSDMRTTVYGIISLVYFWFELPNRNTTAVRNFC